MKIAIHHGGKLTSANTINRTVRAEEIKEMSQLIQQHFQVDTTFNYSAVCMYTNTPDEDFIIDHHPEHHNIIIASPCSGHGFKFSSAIGKLLCDMALGISPDFDITVFNLSRFRK
jgi:glycine/D-amino acid oxidase-like deaminating enzyme